MRVVGLRHGQSEYNLLGLCNDDPARRVELTAQGVDQAQRAGGRLLDQGVERIFASPLRRAERTAGIVARTLGLSVTLEPRLADIRSGCEGRPVAEYLRAIAADPVDARVNGGESLRDYQRRVDGFLDWLDAQSWGCVLLVAHEETLRILDARYHGWLLGAVVGRAFANCEPYVFQSDNGKR